MLENLNILNYFHIFLGPMSQTHYNHPSGTCHSMDIAVLDIYDIYIYKIIYKFSITSCIYKIYKAQMDKTPSGVLCVTLIVFYPKVYEHRLNYIKADAWFNITVKPLV